MMNREKKHGWESPLIRPSLRVVYPVYTPLPPLPSKKRSEGFIAHGRAISEK